MVEKNDDEYILAEAEKEYMKYAEKFDTLTDSAREEVLEMMGNLDDQIGELGKVTSEKMKEKASDLKGKFNQLRSNLKNKQKAQ